MTVYGLRVCVVLWALLLAAPAVAGENTGQGLDFLPPPPAGDSPDWQRDQALYQQALLEKDGPRWRQAIFDADPSLDGNAGAWFLDAFGLRISRGATPALYALLDDALSDLRQAVRVIKKRCQRPRPYVYYKTQGQTCSPEYEEKTRRGGSYPSGHAARGWAMALLLAEISPERQDAILRRGYELGQSRVVCGYHWQSDVDAARLLAGAAVVQLHNRADFMEALGRAREEIRRIRADGTTRP